MTAVLRDQVKNNYIACLYLYPFLLYFYQGIDAQYVSLEDIVPPYNRDLEYNETLGQDFYDDLAITLSARLQECAPRVPVVTGKSPLCNTSFKNVLSLIATCRFLRSRSRIST